MKKSIYYISIVCVFVLMGVVSCSKDLGNYTYTTLDKVTIDVSGLPLSYSLLRFDTLRIKPVVRYKGEIVDPDAPHFKELSFSWEMYPSQLDKLIAEKHILGDSIRLKTLMDKKEAVWEVVFTVTNNNTGVKEFAKFSVAITPSLAEGWMVLYDKDGNTDVGLIVNNEISKTNTTEKVLYDIYSASNNAPILGKPGSIFYSVANITAGFKIYIQSEGDLVSVNPTTFQKIDNFDEIFWSRPAVKAPAYTCATEKRKEFVINNNQLHLIDYTVIGSGRRAFEGALTGNYGILAPWVANTTAGAFDAVLYDQTNKRFLKVGLRGTEIVPITTAQSSTAAFDCNNVGLTFLMADMGWNYYEHFVMKDDFGNYFLLTANFRSGEISTIGKGKYNMSSCPEISSINSIAAGYKGEVFYYSANNHLYQFKYSSNVTSLLWTAPGNQKITNIALQKYYNTNPMAGILFDPKNLCKVLYVATYDEITKMGTVYQMQVNPLSGAVISGTEKKYSGFGRIKAMAWKPYIIN